MAPNTANCAFNKNLLGKLATTAPRAARTANSRPRPSARASCRLATLAQAIKKHTADRSQKKENALCNPAPRNQEDQRGDAASSVGIRVAAFQLSRDVIQIGRCLRERHVRVETAERRESE